MSSHTCRILYWICTGSHIFEADYVENKAIGSTIRTEKEQKGAVGEAISASSEHMIETSLDGSASTSTDESPGDLN
jgi:hypothetical protein